MTGKFDITTGKGGTVINMQHKPTRELVGLLQLEAALKIEKNTGLKHSKFNWRKVAKEQGFRGSIDQQIKEIRARIEELKSD